jgi:hypothetical protein
LQPELAARAKSTAFHFPWEEKKFLSAEIVILQTNNKYRLVDDGIVGSCIRGASLLESAVYSRSHSLRIARIVTYLFTGNYLDTPNGHPLAIWWLTHFVAGIKKP